METFTLPQFLHMFGRCYESVDVSALLAKSKNSLEASWECIFLKLRLTKENPTEIKELQTQRGHLKRPFIRVLSTNVNIDELSIIIQDIKLGYFTINGIRSKLQAGDWKEIADQKISQGGEGYTNSKERTSPFLHGIVFTSMDFSPASKVGKLGLTDTDIGMKFEDINYYLDTQNINNPNNVVFIFPIYCRKLHLNQEEKGDLIAKYEIDRELIGECSIIIRRIVDGKTDIPVLLGVTDLVKKTTEYGYIIDIPIPNKLQPLLPDHEIELEIRHNSLGQIGFERVDTDQVLRPPFHSDPLLDAFLLSEAKGQLIHYVTSTDEKNKLMVAPGY